MSDGVPKSRLLHRGLHARRLDNNPREVAFAKEWGKENENVHGTNYGHGILQDLMVLTSKTPRRGYLKSLNIIDWHVYLRVPFIVRRRDAVIAATVIQWLGSNCGMSFLAAALKRCGYRIVKDEPIKEMPRARD